MVTAGVGDTFVPELAEGFRGLRVMKVAILHPSDEGSTAPFADLDPPRDPTRYLDGPEYSHVWIAKATAVRQVIEVAQAGFDVIINLCDGAWDEDRPGIEVVDALERLNVAFTGAGRSFYDPSRTAMKMAAHGGGVRVPAFVTAKEHDGVREAVARLRFPMMVKHPRGYSSVGISKDSRVDGVDGLTVQVARTLNAFGGALIEEFVEGREFTVLVTEPRLGDSEPWTFTPVEFVFPPGESFKHFDLKWRNHGDMTMRLVREQPLATRLREAASRTFEALEGDGFARCDLRMDAAGEIFILEINPNCGVFYPEGAFAGADLALSGDPGGHSAFLEHLLACALRRQRQRVQPSEVRFERDHGFGLFAARDIGQGELVVRYEETPTALVSRAHVERHWHGLKRQWFAQYAWPVSDGVFQRWSVDPDEWRPINHSCDPNTWLVGLDLVARRPITAGEQLTADYATFCGRSMAEFDCACGAATCRGVVRGTDHLLPELVQRYGDHVSDFIRTEACNGDTRTGLEIRATASGLGVVARQRWATGAVVTELSWGPLQHEPSRSTIQCGEHVHAEPLPPQLRYVNHSCAPNVTFDIDAQVVRAVRDIAPGDELTYFYPSTEWQMAEPFVCGCGAAECLGEVTGASHLRPEVLERYRPSAAVRATLEHRCSGRSSGE